MRIDGDKMPTRLALCSLLITAALSLPANSAETRTIDWNDLRPTLPEIESPFSELTPAQLKDIRTYVGWTTSAPSEKEKGGYRQQKDDAIARLVGAGIDVEDLMSRRRKIILQRNRTALGPNQEILGMPIRMLGYVLPLSLVNQKVTEFLLVPYAGACIHTPVPSPNQIVHVKFPEGVKINIVFESVWVHGRLEAKPTKFDVGYSDGSGTLQANYTLTAGSIKKQRRFFVVPPGYRKH